MPIYRTWDRVLTAGAELTTRMMKMKVAVDSVCSVHSSKNWKSLRHAVNVDGLTAEEKIAQEMFVFSSTHAFLDTILPAHSFSCVLWR